MLESGCVSIKNEVNIMMKNVVDIALGGNIFCMLQFRIHYLQLFLIRFNVLDFRLRLPIWSWTHEEWLHVFWRFLYRSFHWRSNERGCILSFYFPVIICNHVHNNRQRRHGWKVCPFMWYFYRNSNTTNFSDAILKHIASSVASTLLFIAYLQGGFGAKMVFLEI